MKGQQPTVDGRPSRTQHPLSRLLSVGCRLFGSLLFLLFASSAPLRSMPPEYGVVRSERWNSGVPLGGIGCGTFDLLTDATISRATFNNNWNHPTGDLKGCFAALWTNAGGRIRAVALTGKSGYGLPTVAALEYRGLFPQVFIEYPDPDLPIRLSLRAYSSLIPHDLKNSSLPAALFVFTLKNESRAPVEASIAFSWENILGVGGTAARGPFSDRTGNSVEPVRLEEGIFGVRLAAPTLPAAPPPDRLRFNARGNYALLARAPRAETQVTMAGWNALEATPGWWREFAEKGTVSGTVGTGREGTIHPAGVVALRVSLRDRETLGIPFVFAWYTPRYYTLVGAEEYGHFYEKSFDDALEVGRYALQSRLNLAALTDDWQRRLERSSLPAWLVYRLINDAGVLFRHTILTRDSGVGPPKPGPSLFAVYESLGEGRDALGAIDDRLFIQSLLSAFFPALERQELGYYAAAQARSGSIPRAYGHADFTLVKAARSEEAGEQTDPPALACCYVFQVYRRFLQTGDQTFLDEFYPSAKRAVEYVARQTKNGETLLQSRDAACYDATLWLAALLLAHRMAEAMDDKRFLVQCEEWLEAARRRTVDVLWNGDFLRKTAKLETLSPSSSDISYAAQLAGQWMAEAAQAGDILAAERIERALDSLTGLNDRLSAFGPPMEARANGTWGEDTRCWIPHSTTFQAALYALRGRPTPALTLMERITRTLVEQMRSPWQTPLRFHADTGQPDGSAVPMTAGASWSFLEALEGFAVDIAQGRLYLTPRLPEDWKSLAAPIFSPTFWGWMEYRPERSRTLLSFRLDRLIPLTVSLAALRERTGFTIKEVVLPDSAAARDAPLPAVIVSLSRAPVPGKVTRDSKGRPLFTPDAPVQMSPGQRLEFIFQREMGSAGEGGRSSE